MSNAYALLDTAFEPLVAAARGNAAALLRLAAMAKQKGNNDRAVELAEAALALKPDDPEVRLTATDIVAATIPNWHVRLVHDKPRNNAFEAVLKRHIRPGMRVLDVGAGTGLLAMMATRAGADHVWSCEANAPVAAVAADIVAANGLADRITILAKHSSDIDAEADMGGRADLVVAEILGSDLIGEQVLPAMRDVVARLTKPGARLIPQAGDIRLALAWWDDLGRQYMGDASGFDLSLFNRLLPPTLSFGAGDRDVALCGPAASLFSYEFGASDHGPDHAAIDLVADGGPVNGIAQWIRLQMDEESVYDNQPGPGVRSSWGCFFHPLPAPLDLAPGERVRVNAVCRSNRLWLWTVDHVDAR